MDAEGESVTRCYIFPPTLLPLVFVIAACARQRQAGGEPEREASKSLSILIKDSC